MRLAAQHLSETDDFNFLFFGSPQIAVQYLNLSAYRKYTEVIDLFRFLIHTDRNKTELLLNHMFKVWTKNPNDWNMLILDLLKDYITTIPGMHTLQLLRGAVLITQEKYIQGIIQIRESLVPEVLPHILEKYLWPVLKELRSNKKFLQALEKPEEAIIPWPIYFFRGVLALSEGHFTEAKLWLERSITDDFSIEKVEKILEAAQRDRPPLQEISARVAKAAKPPETLSPLPTSTIHVGPAAYGSIQTLSSTPLLPPMIYCERAHRTPPPPVPVALSIPGHQFFVQFFETEVNYFNNQVLFDQNRYQEQTAFYLQILQRAPQKWSLLLNGLFELFPRRHNIPDILALKLLSEVQPENPLPYILRGCFYIHDGQYETGLNLLSEGYSKRPSVQILRTILTLMQKRIQVHPTFPKPHTLQSYQNLFLGIFALSTNRQDQATGFFEQALADPSTKILAQAFREWIGIPVTNKSLGATPPTSPEDLVPPASPATISAAEALAILGRAPANPGELS